MANSNVSFRSVELFVNDIEKSKQFYEAIGIKKPDVQPHATKYVKEMIELIKKLEQKRYQQEEGTLILLENSYEDD